MDKLCIFLILGLVATQVTAMHLREKRQAGNNGNFNPSPADRELLNSIFNTGQSNQGQNNQSPFGNQGQNNQRPSGNQGQNNQLPFGNQGQNNQRPSGNQGQNNQLPFGNQGQTTATTTTTTTTTQAPNQLSEAVRNCMSSCPVTTEYNPVCGSDNVTYNNPGGLACAQFCGVNVTQTRTSRCPNRAA